MNEREKGMAGVGMKWGGGGYVKVYYGMEGAFVCIPMLHIQLHTFSIIHVMCIVQTSIYMFQVGLNTFEYILCE